MKKGLAYLNLIIKDIVEDDPGYSEDGDEEVSAVSPRLPVAVRREGDDLHENFDHETDGQAGTENCKGNVSIMTFHFTSKSKVEQL